MQTACRTRVGEDSVGSKLPYDPSYKALLLPSCLPFQVLRLCRQVRGDAPGLKLGVQTSPTSSRAQAWWHVRWIVNRHYNCLNRSREPRRHGECTVNEHPTEDLPFACVLEAGTVKSTVGWTNDRWLDQHNRCAKYDFWRPSWRSWIQGWDSRSSRVVLHAAWRNQKVNAI